ncbi:Acyl-CoA synthetase (AMP-forming)/AMP-acid ligase II [Parafrankia irregularis]|uniref:Acyl-CoA synthetase (AMP-forming)/AMP-acid ligase II n=1 Tax=Parafrankia irregularis TaxID=795642 RepID=A0A0S4QYF0_9ACTN|nr:MULTISPECIES: AMP-binding protein [Parafrankia]MBE3200356.1 AMP-binding protein [Parafrankia sp. CH37]CUU59784.1 Acyl-CoA synthetase (AMP-forming)/AMP-acid ligase II [Parafrankia irregularis]
MWGTLPEVFDRACLHNANSTAIIDGDRRLTYRQMWRQANQVANGLVALGVGKGERVGLLLPNVAEFITTQHGIWKAGAVLVQMPARASASVHRSNLRQTAATTLIYHSQFDEVVAELLGDENEPTAVKHVIRLQAPGTNAGTETGSAPLPGSVGYLDVFGAQPGDTAPAVPLDEHDEAYVLFTSGSTGEPKGVVNSHFTWAHYSITAGLEIGDIRPGEIFAHGAPLTHYTQIFVMPTFLRGGTSVMLPGLDVDTLLATVEREKITATAVVPTIVYLLLDHPRRAAFDLSSLRTMVYAGAPIAPERLREALEAFGPIFVQTYAGTEPGYVSCLRKEDHQLGEGGSAARLASAGRPLPYVRVSIQNEADEQLPVGEIGEICSRQLGQMLGYLDASRNAEALRGGWVHTGDIGYLDPDGFLYLVDRKKDMIVSGGFNVFPRQVEDVLQTHPAVAQAAVFGIPDPKWGEAVHAVVVPRGGQHAEVADLIGHVRRALGGVPAPKSIDVVDALPVNPAGKVDKKALRTPYWAGRDRQIG